MCPGGLRNQPTDTWSRLGSTGNCFLLAAYSTKNKSGSAGAGDPARGGKDRGTGLGPLKARAHRSLGRSGIC